MSEVMIRVTDLGKRFSINASRQSHLTLRDSVAAALRSPLSALRGKEPSSLWALRNVSFEVRRGEAVGIIGHNGAGKSTLLKILSRVTYPSEGRAELWGVLGSLLEVGTGFHPELSGRENIYLNAAILGMKRREIERKLDEIVSYSEVGPLLDTPVKFYSTGMQTRLAFSVAAHLDADILLIDEVLAVADAAFQKKCLQKVESRSLSGNTILFVSHNMTQMKRFCKRGILLDHGRIAFDGDISGAIAAYESGLDELARRAQASGAQALEHEGFLSWRILEGSSDPHCLRAEGPWAAEMTLNLTQKVSHGNLGVVLQTHDGMNIGGWGINGLALPRGLHKIACRFPHLPIRPGLYHWYCYLWESSRKIDSGNLHPPLLVATPEHSQLSDAWRGLLNMPCEISLSSDGPAAAQP